MVGVAEGEGVADLVPVELLLRVALPVALPVAEGGELGPAVLHAEDVRLLHAEAVPEELLLGEALAVPAEEELPEGLPELALLPEELTEGEAEGVLAPEEVLLWLLLREGEKLLLR